MPKSKKRPVIGSIIGKTSTGFPTLADVKKKAGPLGLQDPKLRRSYGKVPGLA